MLAVCRCGTRTSYSVPSLCSTHINAVPGRDVKSERARRRNRETLNGIKYILFEYVVCNAEYLIDL